jgi:endoglucanase
MALSRRLVLGTGVCLSSLLFDGCVRADGAHGFDWSQFKSTYLAPDGRIIDTGNGGVSHSEGQSYGLIFAQAADDHEAFGRIWSWTQANLKRPTDSLFAWRYDAAATPPVADHNNATDGDIMIAWALLRAGKQWRNADYLKASEDVRASILRILVKPIGKRSVLLPGVEGFDVGDNVIVNPSYYIWPALDAFEAEDGKSIWGDIIKGGQELLEGARFGASNLTPDWIEITPANTVFPAVGHEPRFGFDAVRVPLYLAWTARSQLVEPFKTYWKLLLTNNSVIPAWIDLNTGTVANYPLSTGGLELARFVVGLSPGPPNKSKQDYYSSALGHLTSLARLETTTLASRVMRWL